MMKMLRGAALLSLAGWAMLLPSLLEAATVNDATNLYSRGVHAYFAGRAAEAELLLSRALERHDQDPRFYYFRALSRLRLGRDDEARRDMAAGASLEASRENRYAVGTALQRVQGNHRLLLEQYRRAARARAATVGAEIARQHSEQLNARDAGALREKVVIPLEQLFQPGRPQALSAEEAARRAAELQPAQVAPAMEPAVVPSPPSTIAGEEDPFRDDAAAAEPQPVPPSLPERGSLPEAAPAEAPAEDEADDNPFDF